MPLHIHHRQDRYQKKGHLMEYHKEFIKDFAERTKANLEFIEGRAKRGDTVFEVTQLINSTLGLLVFPKEQYMRKIPDTSLAELEEQGWPRIKVVEGKLPEDNLQQLMRYLRNGIAHCNIEFYSNDHRQVDGLYIWNNGATTWKAKLSIDDLRNITKCFIKMINEDYR